jgi:hypothetical protein
MASDKTSAEQTQDKKKEKEKEKEKPVVNGVKKDDEEEELVGPRRSGGCEHVANKSRARRIRI